MFFAVSEHYQVVTVGDMKRDVRFHKVRVVLGGIF